MQEEIDLTLAAAKSSGVEIVAVSADEQKRWQDAIKPVLSGLDPEVKALVDAALAGP